MNQSDQKTQEQGQALVEMTRRWLDAEKALLTLRTQQASEGMQDRVCRVERVVKTACVFALGVFVGGLAAGWFQ